MNFKRLLHSSLGRIIISILIGLGLATLFRKVCDDKNCLTFRGPILGDIDGKIYKHGEKCFSYSAVSTQCDKNKQTLDMS